MDFTIKVSGHEPFPASGEIPSGLAEYHIPGSEIKSGIAAFGSFMLQAIELDGFNCLYSVFTVEENVTFLVSSFNSALIVRIAVKGNFEHEIKNIGDLFLKEGQYNIFFCRDLNNSFSLQKKHTYISLDINYPVSYMLYALDFFPVFEGFQTNLAKSKPSLLTGREMYANAQISDSIYKIVHSPYSANIKKFHLDIIKDLLFMLLQQTTEMHDSNNKKFPVGQVEKIYKAKEFIDSNLPDHFSIFQIASRAGINEQNLKKGFKEIFGKGLYSYLRHEIFRIAKIQVEQTNRPIKQIAFHAGYKKPNNFSAAFKKKFGYAPLDWRKQFNSRR